MDSPDVAPRGARDGKRDLAADRSASSAASDDSEEEATPFEPWKTIKKDVEKVAHEIKANLANPDSANLTSRQVTQLSPSSPAHFKGEGLLTRRPSCQRKLSTRTGRHGPALRDLLEKAHQHQAAAASRQGHGHVKKGGGEPLSSPILFQSILSTLQFVLVLVWLGYGALVFWSPTRIGGGPDGTQRVRPEGRPRRALSDTEKWAQLLQLADGTMYVGVGLIGLMLSVNGCFSALLASKSQYETTVLNFILLFGRCIFQCLMPFLQGLLLGMPLRETWHQVLIGAVSLLLVGSTWRVWYRLWRRLDREERETRDQAWKRINGGQGRYD
jgi:hypothetical protein